MVYLLQTEYSLIMNQQSSVDIDTIDDWDRAEFILKNYQDEGM